MLERVITLALWLGFWLAVAFASQTFGWVTVFLTVMLLVAGWGVWSRFAARG